MFSCPKCKVTTALCKVCGSKAHWTRACHQRYFPEEFVSSVRSASGVNRGRVSRLPWTRKKQEKTPEKVSKTEESAGGAATEKGVVASAALLENPLGWDLGLSVEEYDKVTVSDPNSRILRYWVEVHGEKVNALLDTGATHSFVKGEWARRHNLPTKPCSVASISFFNLQSSLVVQEARVSVQIGDRKRKWKFLVMEVAPYPVVLGIDFLRCWGLVLDPTTLDLFVPRSDITTWVRSDILTWGSYF